MLESEKRKTTGQKIAYLLRELCTPKSVDASGRLSSARLATAARGRSAKNIARILRKGRERLAKLKAAGIDLTVLPPESPIRKRAEADWARLLRYGFAKSVRGVAGREATSRRKRTLRERARALHAEGSTVQDIAEQIGRTARTVRRYLTGR